MKHFLYIMLISILLSKHYGLTHVIRVKRDGVVKRQLFREQVLPHTGGKIPDSAFHTDRLALNRLQQDGIAIPDGILLQQRIPQVYPHPQRGARPTIPVTQTDDGRYTSPEGEYNPNHIATVETTYAVPTQYEKSIFDARPALPTYKEVRIPNYSVFNFAYSSLKHRPKPSTAAIVSAYTPQGNRRPTSQPNRFASPQSFVNSHTAFGNQLSYQHPGYVYGVGLNGAYPSDVSHLGLEALANPLNFEALFGDATSIKQRYYRKVDDAQSPAEAGSIRSSRMASSFTQQSLAKGQIPLSSSPTYTTIIMLRVTIATVVGLLCVVQCVKVDYYGSLYQKDELHAPYKSAKEPKQDFSKIPGQPGVDYPIYHEVPHTSFSCAHVPAIPGMYANVETGCQAYHTCHDGREGHQGASFLCTNGTIFNQKEFACDWWYNVKCEEAPSLYSLNADPEHNPFVPKKKLEEEPHHKKFLIHV
ncbi:uncharacterized protein LOC129774437 [Toxorhynchites rutilus septentrionalis]|uniref:uncharacterized protein LOC129774437 n=1 Tax=Toxorhynchites rutilus septentrionalis TaxID=329112 RepID=UPI002479EB2C|nr:uncharacterized protein LOC129774437 [Toxorhynchites rutilus septentrionalis]